MPRSTTAATELPTQTEIAAAAESLRVLKPLLSTEELPELQLLCPDEIRAPVSLPLLALRSFLEVLGQMAAGNAVSVVPVHAELTTQEGADLLNVSRPYLVKLLDEGAIPHTKAGRHRRVKLSDVLAYRQARELSSRVVMDRLAAEAQDLGMGY
ncbi:helix-turn-helix domain-containing protein [Pseudomonas sp. PDM17]|uniref:helix-turn-helix domain-containing protein n=1 Tax=Pseudomonas sp. PDM17 TaxID=2769285 RepID=UPI00178059D5|nr:helix-turn-helix domain-containing protein [Pseudomonas sp. PDM17]MBD9503749.1 helix-turn-helix domain-containing protein [Pseudomonas sp. PDM17]